MIAAGDSQRGLSKAEQPDFAAARWLSPAAINDGCSRERSMIK
jgi:hypothetical protein